MDLRHKETKNHTDRVTQMAVALARKVGITDPQELECIKRGSILHDIGKIGTPDEILIKPEKLTAEEWTSIKEHPNIAHEIISKIKYLKPCIDIPL
jgi:putative nucleotidyltransferase with HDIG domain